MSYLSKEYNEVLEKFILFHNKRVNILLEQQEYDDTCTYKIETATAEDLIFYCAGMDEFDKKENELSAHIYLLLKLSALQQEKINLVKDKTSSMKNK